MSALKPRKVLGRDRALRRAFGAEKARGDFLPVGGFYKTMHVLVACA
jgi:hypothetical protein